MLGFESLVIFYLNKVAVDADRPGRGTGLDGDEAAAQEPPFDDHEAVHDLLDQHVR